MKVFVDNDVILDVVLARWVHNHSFKLLELIEHRQIYGYTSPVIFTNSYYVIRKLTGQTNALRALKKMRLLLNVVKIDQKILDMALASDFTDFEDAIQYYTAIDSNLDYLVTRNKQDYVGEQIPVVNPEEILALHTLN